MKAILFDLDGTLIDSSEGITKSAQYALAHFGIDEPDLTKIYFFIGPPLIDTFMNHYGFSREQAVEAVAVCRRILEHFGILGLFDDVVGATMDGRIDTKEEVLNEVMRRWSEIPKEEMCLIGDTMFDIDGANMVGVPSIAVSFGFGNVDEMLKAGAKTVIDDLRELPAKIKEIFQR